MRGEKKKQELIGLRAELIAAREQLKELTKRVETLEGQIDAINEEMKGGRHNGEQRALSERYRIL